MMILQNQLELENVIFELCRLGAVRYAGNRLGNKLKKKKKKSNK